MARLQQMVHLAAPRWMGSWAARMSPACKMMGTATSAWFRYQLLSHSKPSRAHVQDHGLASTDGTPGSPALDARFGSPREAGSPAGQALASSPGVSLRPDGGYRPGTDSERLAVMVRGFST